MNKSELIEAMAEKSGLSKKEAESALKSFEDVVREELIKGGKVQLVGFVTIDVTKRAARMGKNPQTQQPLEIPATIVPRFKAGKSLKDAVKGE